VQVEPAEADFLILAGLACQQAVAACTLKVLDAPLPEGSEALVVRRTEIEGKPAVVLCAADARGLMYAALDTADRVSWSENPRDPFAHVQDTDEKPYLLERAVSIYTMQRAYFESRLYNEDYWRRYFGVLARSRINSFAVIFGYETGGFMAPPYPYFFDVPEFPDVKLIGITPDRQQRNVTAFKKMIRIAHDRGIDVTAGIWDHIYRGGVQGGGIEGASEKAGKQTEGLVWGVTAENLAAGRMIRLRATVATDKEPTVVRVASRSDDGHWSSVDMRPVGRWQYQADVPLKGESEKIRYFIEATDSQGFASSMPAAGADDPILITITNDNAPTGGT